MSELYTTRVTAVGGRHGTVKSDDGLLDLQLATPKELGGRGGATNPEQLFAAGYAACFENAVIHATRRQADKVGDKDIEVIGEVSLLPNGAGGFQLAVTLDVAIAGRPGQGRRDRRRCSRRLPLLQRHQGQCRRQVQREHTVI